jgi:uncharacterized protein (TIGR02453 family)
VTTSAAEFAGFGEDTIEFFEGLTADNSREYWQQHRGMYDDSIAGPMSALADSLTAEFGPPKIFRMHRDLRFSPDRRPYHEYARMGVRPPRPAGRRSAGVLFLSLSGDGLYLAAGYYDPARDQLEKFRRLQDDPAQVGDLDRTLERLAAAGLPLGDGRPLKTAPRGWPRDHPRIEFLRHTTLTVGARHPPAPWLSTAECLTVVTEAWRSADTWNRWLDSHVGPSRQPPPSRRGQ